MYTIQPKKLSRDEEKNKHSWEQTVKSIFDRNNENVLLEFTATCDLANLQIRTEYENKIIFDYPLHKFREDLYSKEIKTLRSDMDIMDRAIQALMLSQYRLKVFQDNHLAIKPVVLFKSAKIADSKEFMELFLENIRSLSGSTLERISNLIDNPTMNLAYRYFESKKISFNMLAQELREDFSEEHCISVNDDKEADKKQILLNSLEDTSNPYRAIEGTVLEEDTIPEALILDGQQRLTSIYQALFCKKPVLTKTVKNKLSVHFHCNRSCCSRTCKEIQN